MKSEKVRYGGWTALSELRNQAGCITDRSQGRVYSVVIYQGALSSGNSQFKPLPGCGETPAGGGQAGRMRVKVEPWPSRLSARRRPW